MKPVTRSTRMRSWAEGDRQKRTPGVRDVAVRLGAIGLFGALGLAGVAPATARAQAAGQSVSYAYVHDYATSSTECSHPSGFAATTSATCLATPVYGASGTSTTMSVNAARTAAASFTFTKTGGTGIVSAASGAFSNQASALTVTGTPLAGDQLVFHFLTSQSAMGSGGSADVWGSWTLNLSDGSNTAFADQYAYADGTQSAMDLTNATKTVAGFDLTLPFSVGSTFSYLFSAGAGGAGTSLSQPAGATVTGSLSAYLQGIDAESANGTLINSASFDESTGLGTISATTTTTTPEPGSLALLGTGVIGLIPVMRRRKP